MNITVADLRDYLVDYPEDAIIRFDIGKSNGLTVVADFGFISESNGEVILHPTDAGTYVLGHPEYLGIEVR